MYNSYLNYELNKAKNYLYQKFNKTSNFTYNDCLEVLNTFGTTFETNLVKISNYLPTKGNDFTSIETFTKGFISNPCAKILITMTEKRMEVFVLEFRNKYLNNYFSLNINNDILKILYLLEEMKSIDKVD